MESLINTRSPVRVKITALALFALAIGLSTSVSIMTGFQALMAVAIVLSLPHFSGKKFPWSARFLVLLGLVMALTVVLNWDVYERPWKAFFRVRYFIVGALSIIPLNFYLNQYLSPKSRAALLQKLLLILVLATNLASLSGLIGFYFGYNPIRLESLEIERNSGAFGSIMAYAHSVSWLSLFIINVWVHRKKFNLGLPDWYLVFSIVLSLEGLFTTYTRGAMLAWFLGCLLISRKIAFSGLLFFILSSWGASYFNQGFVSNHVVRSGSNEERLGAWLGAVEAFKMRPILGVGYLNYDPLSKKIKEEHGLPAPYYQGNAHNDYLEILACEGAIGFLVFLSWMGFWIVETYRKGKLAQAFVYPGILAFLVSGLTQVTLYTSETLVFFMLTYALSIVLFADQGHPSLPAKSRTQ